MPEKDTYFAPAARADVVALQRQIVMVTRNPVIDGVLKSVPGLLAVLNEQRQILAVNDCLLDELGIEKPESVLGLRPGEALDCVHAREEPGGCGTTRFCSSCGAALAIVASLGFDEPVERECAATVRRDGKLVDILLKVRSVPIRFSEERFLLLFLQDITKQRTWAALEQIFVHDLSNLLTGLMSAAALLKLDANDQETTRSVHQLASRLAKEVKIQRAMIDYESNEYQFEPEEVDIALLMHEIKETFGDEDVDPDKASVLAQPTPAGSVHTDPVLLTRILTNMIKNALEASAPGGEVRLWSERSENQVSFQVWNEGVIPENVQLRIFQRYFSTKRGSGRGLGTYSMKLLGEKMLKGKVDFNSNATNGTTFRLTLPINPEA